MSDEIKQKISLEGEKEYSAALREANRNLKTLRSELKAETAELGNNASAQQKNETKSRSLRKQIEQQEKVVSTLKSALKEAKERYGDNSAEVAKWEQKLNGARYTLASMNNDLEASERALKEQQDALKDSADSYDDAANAASDYADAVGDAGATADAVTFQGIMTAADNLTGKLKSALDFIVNLGKASWEWMSDSGEWADTLTTEAQNYGVSRETLQGWRYAARFVDTEVETIGNAFNKLTNRSDAVNKKLEEIGIVADKGVKGQDLFWPVIEAIGRLDDAAKENAAMDIFGKSFRDLLPLINAGQEAWEGYVKEAEESGYVLSEEQVDKLGAFDDANQKLQASFEAMQHTIAAELAPAFTEVSKAMSGLIDSFTEWAKTEEGQKTLHDLGDALKGLVDTITGEQNFKGLVDGAAEAVKGLTDALGWISEHWEEVKNGLGFIGAAMGALTIGKDVLSALMLIKGIKWFGGGGGGKGGITDTVTATAGGGPIAAAGNFLTGITSKAASFIGQGGMLFQGGVLGDWFTNQTNAGRALRDGMDVIDGLTQDINEAKDTISKNASTFAEDWKGVGENILELPFMQKARANGENTIRFWDQFYKNIGSGVKGFWDQLTMAGQNRRGSEQAIEVAAGEEGDALGQAFVNYVKANQELQDIFNGNAEYSDERANELVEQVEAARELFQGMEGSEDVMKAYSDWLQENSYGSDSWKLPDEIPAGWFSDVLDSMTWENSGTLTSDDVSGFAALPGSIEEAVANGIASGTSGMSITMDGVTVGRVVAPYVSQELAFGIP